MDGKMSDESAMTMRLMKVVAEIITDTQKVTIDLIAGRVLEPEIDVFKDLLVRSTAKVSNAMRDLT